MKKNPDHAKSVVDLKRIEGQIRGVQNMIDERKYCIDILHQVHAVMGALARVEDKILGKHLEHCVLNAAKSGSKYERDQKLQELLKVVHQFRKV